MIDIFQLVFSKITTIVGGIAIFLGIHAVSINSTPLPQQPPIISTTILFITGSSV
ncbi:MAG: hypothetical protein NTZ20_03920 [Candidatus Levybacteria bacterium]|nr:hypothetical protein [Candidatus Levybacteria bacterium]